MNLLATLRQRKTIRARRVTGMFLFVWLSMALQPCVMAFGMDGMDGDHGCPHCPPPVESMHHGSHDMASANMSCASGAGCTALDDFNYDGRTPQTKVKDPAPEPVAILSMAVLEPVVVEPVSVSLFSLRAQSSGASPPLNVLYCTYLN